MVPSNKGLSCAVSSVLDVGEAGCACSQLVGTFALIAAEACGTNCRVGASVIMFRGGNDVPLIPAKRAKVTVVKEVQALLAHCASKANSPQQNHSRISTPPISAHFSRSR
jgi:hypothetical protein